MSIKIIFSSFVKAFPYRGEMQKRSLLYLEQRKEENSAKKKVSRETRNSLALRNICVQTLGAFYQLLVNLNQFEKSVSQSGPEEYRRVLDNSIFKSLLVLYFQKLKNQLPFKVVVTIQSQQCKGQRGKEERLKVVGCYLKVT